MKERRNHSRYELDLPVTLRTEGKLIPAACMDVSLGGVCLLTEYNENISKGEAEVTFDLSPNARDVSVRGRILRLQKGIGQKVAIEFTNPNSKGLDRLKDFLNKQVN